MKYMWNRHCISLEKYLEGSIWSSVFASFIVVLVEAYFDVQVTYYENIQEYEPPHEGELS